MLDVKFIKQNLELVKNGCRNKQVKVDVDRILFLDGERRKFLQQIESLRAQKNKASEEIKRGGERERLIQEMKIVDKQEGALKPKLKTIEDELQNLLYSVPNLPAKDVPTGESEKQNITLRQRGKLPKFAFPAKDYMTIAEKLDIIDTKRAAKAAGSRFGYLKNEAALLEFALVQFTLDFLTDSKKIKKIAQKCKVPDKPFIPVIPPALLNEKAMRAMGYLEHGGQEETYYLPKDKFYLAATSEQSIGPMHMDEIFDEKDLPLRYVGFSSCFRREAGSYGKDTTGILRVHQFDKLEMFVFSAPETSDKEHEFLLALEEALVQALKIPYQVIKMCTADLGLPAARKYDIECWIPSQNKYRETHSASTCTDFQARRLNIRYRNQSGGVEFVHTLNGTAFAIGRILIAIIENFQQKDGSIKIPQCLQRYCGLKLIKR